MTKWLRNMVCGILIFSISGCSLNWEQTPATEEVSDQVIQETVKGAIESEWLHIEGFLEDIPAAAKGLDAEGNIDLDMIIEETLNEELGKEYLDFCYTVVNSENVDEVLNKAKVLLPEAEYAQLVEKTEESKSIILAQYATQMRALSEEQRPAFMKDLQKLVVRSTVLLTASIVYACIPKLCFWGKVSAAAAISIAAGAVASTTVALYNWYKYGGDFAEAFSDWLKSVTVEPEASYALAASVIATANSMKLTPVSCGLVLSVFAMYQALDMLKAMMAAYDL